MVSEASHTLIKLYGHYKQQILPFAGGILEQPHYYIQAMEIIDAAVNDGNTHR